MIKDTPLTRKITTPPIVKAATTIRNSLPFKILGFFTLSLGSIWGFSQEGQRILEGHPFTGFSERTQPTTSRKSSIKTYNTGDQTHDSPSSNLECPSANTFVELSSYFHSP